MTLDPILRSLLAALGDALIPAGDGFPSASEAGVAGAGLDQLIEARPDLAEPLRRILEKFAGRDAADVVAELRADDPAGFGVLTESVAGAYFLNPNVRAALGYQGQNARAIDPRPDYLDDGLLQSVIARGPIYRPTPGQGQRE